jgi:hypothetical protein
MLSCQKSTQGDVRSRVPYGLRGRRYGLLNNLLPLFWLVDFRRVWGRPINAVSTTFNRLVTKRWVTAIGGNHTIQLAWTKHPGNTVGKPFGSNTSIGGVSQGAEGQGGVSQRADPRTSALTIRIPRSYDKTQYLC